MVQENKADKVIFDNNLRTLQTYNLAKATRVEVIDRFQLILEIFTTRATTTEAQLQIQLATLKNELKHAKEKVRLSKGSEQPGFMGLGVYEADVYREAIKRQVQTIRKKLTHIQEKRIIQRARRAELGFLTISLAGYTSSGKSTLFNAVTQEDARVDKALFTTLSTQTRIIEFSNRKFLLTDTVGFIDRLPISLIEAFHSTLEETIFSDLIVLLVDFSEPIDSIEKKINVCLETIERLGASGIPMITALNKIDLVKPEEREEKLNLLKDKVKNPILLSAKRQINLNELKKNVLRILENYSKAQFRVPLSDNMMSFLSWVHQKTDLHKEEFKSNSVEVVFEANPSIIEQVKRKVQDLNGEFQFFPNK